MSKLEDITLVTVCDNHYSVMLAALMKSIESNHYSEEKINFHIVSDGINSNKKRKLEHCIISSNINILWHNLTDVIPINTALPLDGTSYPLNMYARLFIPYFLPEQVKKAIYLDVDMIVEKDISELWNIDINNNTIGAVVDQLEIIGGSEWTAIPNYKELGFNPQLKYFNSGLLIMNLTKWRKEDITTKVFDCIEQNKEHIRFPDQYGLNVVFIDQWFELENKWNSYANKNIKDPAIIHFIMIKPIYDTYNLNENYKIRFYHYLKLTPWQNFKPLGKFYNYFQKGKNKLKKKYLGIVRRLN